MEEQPQAEHSVICSILGNRVFKFLFNNVLVGLLLWALTYFFVEQRKVEPRYAVSEPELLAEQTTDTPRLTLLWYGEEIENVYSIKIAIWNAGKEWLDSDRLSDSDPVRVICPQETQILYNDFIKTSRSSLDFDTTDLIDGEVNSIQLKIKDDESLYKGDGGILKILYSGGSTSDFTVTGRVKGSPMGFVKTDWTRGLKSLSRGEIVYFGFLTFGVGGIFMISPIALSRQYRDYKSNKISATRFMGIVIVLACGCGFALYVSIRAFLIVYKVPAWIG